MLRAVGVSESAVEMTAVRAALSRVSGELCALVASATNSDVAVPGSEWNVGEVTAHIAVGTEAYVGYLSGVTESFVDVTDIAHGSLARSNAARLDAEPERQMVGLAQRLRAASSALLEQTEGRDRDEVWPGTVSPSPSVTCLASASPSTCFTVATSPRALSRPWTIRPDDARLVLAAALPLLALLVDPVTTATVNARYDVRVRGGVRRAVIITHGELNVVSDDVPVDCHVSADPVALLLSAYGRRSQWVPILTGKLVACIRYLVTP